MNFDKLRFAVVVLLGAAVAFLGDHLHVAYKVLYYPHPALFRQAVWVYPLFLVAVASMLFAGERFRERLGGQAFAPSLSEAIYATAAFFVAYAFTAVGAELPTVVLAVLVLTWSTRVRRMPKWIVPFSLATAVAGVVCESLLSRAGGFYYVDPDFLGVPRWLPGLYLHAALAAPRMAAVVRRR